MEVNASAAYAQLVAKVDAFFGRVQQRYGGDLACRAGCAGCCGHHLSLSAIEADSVRRGLASLDAPARAELASRGRAASGLEGPCPALEEDGRCGIYTFRPLVCRTQGVPMRIPGHSALPVLAEERAGDAGRSVCPLNFTTRPLDTVDADCVLDLDTLDATLAVINAHHADAEGEDRLARVRLGDLLAGANG